MLLPAARHCQGPSLQLSPPAAVSSGPQARARMGEVGIRGLENQDQWYLPLPFAGQRSARKPSHGVWAIKAARSPRTLRSSGRAGERPSERPQASKVCPKRSAAARGARRAPAPGRGLTTRVAHSSKPTLITSIKPPKQTGTQHHSRALGAGQESQPSSTGVGYSRAGTAGAGRAGTCSSPRAPPAPASPARSAEFSLAWEDRRADRSGRRSAGSTRGPRSAQETARPEGRRG